jgi:hypothetical protein
VVGLSIPYKPRGPVSLLIALRSLLGEDFYTAYFQQPGVAEAELEPDVRTTMRMRPGSVSGDAPADRAKAQPVVPQGGGFLDIMLDPETLPACYPRGSLCRVRASTQYANSSSPRSLRRYSRRSSTA